MDEVTTIEDITVTIEEYRAEQELDKKDTVTELIKAITVESSELLETTLFRDCINKDEVIHKLADVFIYCFALASFMGVDVEDIINKKIEYNKNRGRTYDE